MLTIKRNNKTPVVPIKIRIITNADSAPQKKRKFTVYDTITEESQTLPEKTPIKPSENLNQISEQEIKLKSELERKSEEERLEKERSLKLIETQENELNCPMCLEIFIPPIQNTNCGHNFCQFCLESLQFSARKKAFNKDPTEKSLQ